MIKQACEGGLSGVENMNNTGVYHLGLGDACRNDELFALWCDVGKLFIVQGSKF